MEKELPEEDEVLLGIVDRIVGTSVFVKLENYDKEGVISFSEVAPGRIRNIRDYVRPGQRIVVKVLRIDPAIGHIDLSLRRVSAKEKKEVLAAYEQEKDAKVLVGLVVKEKTRSEQLIAKIEQKLSLSELMSRIQELVDKPEKAIAELTKIGFSTDEASRFVRLITEKIKQKLVSVRTEITLSTEAADGIERIKKLLGTKNAKIKYVSAPRYMIEIKDKSYKDANKKLKELITQLRAKALELGCSFSSEEK